MKGKLLLSTCSLLLVACGGSGDAGGDQGSNGNNARLVGDFVRQATKCDARAANTSAKVILHRKDGSVMSTHQPNASGRLDIDWPADAAHITLVTTSNGELRLDTQLVRSSGDLGINAAYDDSLNLQCECNPPGFCEFH